MDIDQILDLVFVGVLGFAVAGYWWRVIGDRKNVAVTVTLADGPLSPSRTVRVEGRGGTETAALVAAVHLKMERADLESRVVRYPGEDNRG